MKLTRIKALCKARELVELFDRKDGKQFLSDGCGVWPVDDRLVLNEEMVRIIFEVSRKKWESDWSFQHIRFGEDEDAEICGLPECMLDDFWKSTDEIELTPLHEWAMFAGTEMKLFTTSGPQPRYLWTGTKQFSACPSEIRRYALRTAPDGTRAIAVYDDVFLGGLVRVLNMDAQMEIRQKFAVFAALEMM